MPNADLQRIVADVRAIQAKGRLTVLDFTEGLIKVVRDLRALKGVPELDLGNGYVINIVYGEAVCISPLPRHNDECQSALQRCISIGDLANALERVVGRTGDLPDPHDFMEQTGDLLEAFDRGSPACGAS